MTSRLCHVCIEPLARGAPCVFTPDMVMYRCLACKAYWVDHGAIEAMSASFERQRLAWIESQDK